MGLTWFNFDGLIAQFHGLVRHLGRAPWRGHRQTPAARCSRPTGLHMQAGRAQVAWSTPCRSTALRRPLKVLRVVDACHSPSSAGRMVISGRMADVCAELDRLAALEATAA
jgi:hypothetical protein